MKNLKFINPELVPYIETLISLEETISKRNEEINEYNMREKCDGFFDLDQKEFIDRMITDAESEIERCYYNIEYLGKEALDYMPLLHQNRITVNELMEKYKPQVDEYNNCNNSMLAMKNSYRSSHKNISELQAYIDLKHNKKFNNYSKRKTELSGCSEIYDQLQYDNKCLGKLEFAATGTIRPIGKLIVTDSIIKN